MGPRGYFVDIGFQLISLVSPMHAERLFWIIPSWTVVISPILGLGCPVVDFVVGTIPIGSYGYTILLGHVVMQSYDKS